MLVVAADNPSLSAYANTASLFSTTGLYERRDCDVSIFASDQIPPMRPGSHQQMTGSVVTILLFSVSSYAVSVELATASGLMSREMTAETATSHPHIPSRRQRRGKIKGEAVDVNDKHVNQPLRF